MGGGKNRNKKVQPYAVFVSEEAKRLGISTQEAFDRCGDTWKNMTDDERQRYKNMASGMRTGFKGRAVSPTTLGFRQPWHQDDSLNRQLSKQGEVMNLETEDEINYRMGNYIDNSFFKDDELVNTETVFILGHLNVFCEPRDKKAGVFPAEIGLAKVSLSKGVIETYSKVMTLVELPQIYTFEAQKWAEKKHHIPHKAFDPFMETDRFRIRQEISNFLRKEPVFVMHRDTEDMRRFFSMIGLDSDAFDAATLLKHMELSIYGPLEDLMIDLLKERLTPEYKEYYDQIKRLDILKADLYERLTPENKKFFDQIEELTERMKTNIASAEVFLDDDTPLYKTKSNESCDFHWALDEVQHCSLNVVKRRGYAFCEEVISHLNSAISFGCIPPERRLMKLEGKTFPQSREIKATEERLPNLKKFLQNAVRKEFVNEFGQQVTRAGTMGGQVNGDLDFDAASALREGKKRFERENIVARNAMSTLSLGTGESASERSRGGSVLSSSYKYYEDDGDTASQTNTVTSVGTAATARTQTDDVASNSDLVSRTTVTSSAVSSVKNEGPFKRAVLPARNSGGWAGVVAGKEKSVASTTTSQSSERRPRKIRPVAKFE